MPNASGLERKIDQYTELGEGGDVQTYLELGGTINDALGYLFGECCYKAWSLKFRNLKETKAIPHCDNDDLINPVRLVACGIKDGKPPKTTPLPFVFRDVYSHVSHISTGHYRR
ncbi:hypothetical protein PIIN_11575 [Serendipita indica DSM 11827]|uniref:Uncharacterized protein n=1 Tax=Serendipita indica (strain DSM 11827) TaxID=1109443 RepID=G4U205_SERID|nr:hypothetical protein PIIN_11575 [Serendipita indica DSM 11827]